MKPDSKNSEIFSSLKCKFIAPLFILQEFNKYREECLKKSGLSKKVFVSREVEIISRIHFIEFKLYKEFIKEAIDISLDPDDAPYFALALKSNVPVWSNDNDLKKQNKIIVLSTKDIIDLIF